MTNPIPVLIRRIKAVCASIGCIVPDNAVAQFERSRIEQPATAARAAVAQSKPGNGDGYIRGDLKNAAVRVAADSQVRRAGTEDGKVIRDEQFPSRDRDGAGDGEVDRVARGSVLDGLAQRAGAAIIGVGDGERGRECRSRASKSRCQSEADAQPASH